MVIVSGDEARGADQAAQALRLHPSLTFGDLNRIPAAAQSIFPYATVTARKVCTFDTTSPNSGNLGKPEPEKVAL